MHPADGHCGRPGRGEALIIWDTSKIGTAERVTASEQDGARVVLSSGEVLSGDAVVIAAGPWTNLAKLFSDSPGLQRQPRLTMLGQKYHSLLVKPRSGRVLNEAVFFQGLGET